MGDANHQYEYVQQDLVAWYPKLRKGGLLCGDDIVDLAEDRRDKEGNLTIVWQNDESGQPKDWGTYGVLAAVRDFAKKHKLEYLTAASQFFIIKP